MSVKALVKYIFFNCTKADHTRYLKHDIFRIAGLYRTHQNSIPYNTENGLAVRNV